MTDTSQEEATEPGDAGAQTATFPAPGEHAVFKIYPPRPAPGFKSGLISPSTGWHTESLMPRPRGGWEGVEGGRGPRWALGNGRRALFSPVPCGPLYYGLGTSCRESSLPGPRAASRHRADRCEWLRVSERSLRCCLLRTSLPAAPRMPAVCTAGQRPRDSFPSTRFWTLDV